MDAVAVGWVADVDGTVVVVVAGVGDACADATGAHVRDRARDAVVAARAIGTRGVVSAVAAELVARVGGAVVLVGAVFVRPGTDPTSADVVDGARVGVIAGGAVGSRDRHAGAGDAVCDLAWAEVRDDAGAVGRARAHGGLARGVRGGVVQGIDVDRVRLNGVGVATIDSHIQSRVGVGSVGRVHRSGVIVRVAGAIGRDSVFRRVGALIGDVSVAVGRVLRVTTIQAIQAIRRVGGVARAGVRRLTVGRIWAVSVDDGSVGEAAVRRAPVRARPVTDRVARCDAVVRHDRTVGRGRVRCVAVVAGAGVDRASR